MRLCIGAAVQFVFLSLFYIIFFWFSLLFCCSPRLSLFISITCVFFFRRFCRRCFFFSKFFNSIILQPHSASCNSFHAIETISQVMYVPNQNKPRRHQNNNHYRHVLTSNILHILFFFFFVRSFSLSLLYFIFDPLTHAHTLSTNSMCALYAICKKNMYRIGWFTRVCFSRFSSLKISTQFYSILFNF